MGVEFRHLEAFLAAAEEGSISRAARLLRVTQPALSRTLSQLEQQVGTTLLRRSAKGVELTVAGMAFRTKAIQAVKAFTEALSSPFDAPRPLRVGHAWAALGRFTTNLIQRWRSEYREYQLHLRQVDDVYAKLDEAAIDIAVVRGRRPGPGYRHELLYQEARLVAVPLQHELANRRSVTLGEVARYDLVVNTASGTTEPDLWKENRRPAVTVEVGTVDDWLSNIAAGAGLGITPDPSSQLYQRPEIVYVPLSDAPPVAVYLAWPPHSPHPALRDFLAVAKALVG
ncbi:LysR family transcriptional regulator [Amycolatopsis coloradensis]|uniref:LysR family transcriptional regulator n=1 Tax=Amycolatopsis coloradensis TaxID=76021 RepID=A0A1R0KIF6_9PSEU|nr:LysR family transcriptional regulator [Amycolatopsis coloradensis]OLZ45519.1 LysR family transcriptional regulator [Amycolatopsis coloradensis]